MIPHTSADLTVDKRQKILEWVSGVKCEDHHAEVVKIRLEGTGTWLLQRQEVQGWLESEESSILWLHGKGNIYTSVLLEQGLTPVSSWIREDSAQVCISFHNYGAKYSHGHSRLALELLMHYLQHMGHRLLSYYFTATIKSSPGEKQMAY